MTEFYHDPGTNTLIYPSHELITRSIPDAKQVNGKYVAVPRTLHNCQVLRWYNFPVMPIITDENYDWPRPPSISHPYESQKLTANFLVLHRRCFCFSEMGTGKTLSALWASDFLMRQYPRGTFKVLIVCPISVMQRTWGDEIFRSFLSKRTFTILHGSAEKRLTELEKDVDYFIVNPDGVGVGAHTRKKFELDGFSKALAERKDIRMCIVDEASAYKEPNTKRHRIARLVFGQKDYLTLMTGTPTANSPVEAYGLAKLVNNAHGKSKTGFKLETMAQISKFIWKPRPDGYERAKKLLTPSIRFDLKDVWDGPEMTTQQRQVPLTDEQKKLLAEIKRNLQVLLKSGQAVPIANEAAARTKFLQISLGAIYDAGHKAHAIDATPRFEELKAVLEEAPGKVLVFAPLTSVIDILYKKLKDITSVEVVDGRTSQTERSRIFQDFQQEQKPRVLVAHAGVMAHGLNLWMAQTVVWFGPVDSTEIYLQACRRAHRPGQRFPVAVVQLVSNVLEREIFKRLETNTSLQGALLDAVRRGEL